MGRPPIIAENISFSRKADTGFVVSVILLCGLGIATLYSTSGSYALKMFGDSLYFFWKQLGVLFFSVVCMLILVFINLDVFRRFLPGIVVITLLLCFLTFIPGIGMEKNGAHRWIGFGSRSFQPSELVKFTIILFLSNLFAKKHDRLDEPSISIIPALIILMLFFLVVYLQNDLSTSLFILSIGLIMFFIAGVKLRWFLGFAVIGIPLVILFLFSKPYRVMRILSYLKPELDPQGGSYQAMAAKQALISGGFWGRGLGGGLRKISSIPEIQADFIFAGLAEEMGFVGVVGFFLLLGFFAWRGYKIAVMCTDRFRSLLCFGSVTIIVLQSLLNCGVVSTLLPSTGIPLPFFSSGGSSLLITLSLCGIIINISRWNSVQENRL